LLVTSPLRRLCTRAAVACCVAAAACIPRPAAAQSQPARAQVGLLFSQVRMTDFDPQIPLLPRNLPPGIVARPIPLDHWFDAGLGGRASFYIHRFLSVETEVLLFPRHFDQSLKDPALALLSETSYRYSDKLFWFSGVRVGTSWKTVELFTRIMPGLTQIGRMPSIDQVGVNEQGQPVYFRPLDDETRASVIPGLLLGGGVAVRIAGRASVRFDAADTLLWYRPQSPVPDDFRRHNFQMITGLGIDITSPDAAGIVPETSPRTSSSGWRWGASVSVARGVAQTSQHASVEHSHFLIGIEPRVRFAQWKRWAFAYTPQLLPVVTMSNVPQFRDGAAHVLHIANGQESFILPPEIGSGPAVGIGGVPFAAEVSRSVSARWQAYGGAGVGGLWFSRRVPDVAGREFNYTFEFGGGMQRDYGRREYIRFGYKYHHMSNDYTAPSNPGVITHMLAFGIGLR
jgi:hypothetical protein